MSDAKSWIVAPLGYAPSRDERAFFEGERPWGFILFGRNLASPSQLAELVEELKEIGGRDTTPIFIDQEGGRIRRLKPPFAPQRPAPGVIGPLYREDPERAIRAAFLHGRLLAADLAAYGINANCVPCLDVPVAGAHDIIGDRALHSDPEIVAVLGRAMADGTMAGAALPVMKHMPGHGRGRSDSHHELPVVFTEHAELAETDFLPFSRLADLPCAMTAHILYHAIDSERCATLSPRVVSEVIRDEIGFDGLLMTDDISMKALSGSFRDLSAEALAAGCDLVLHCNGDMAEMREVAKATRPLTGATERRAARAEAVIAGEGDTVDVEALSDEYEALLAIAA